MDLNLTALLISAIAPLVGAAITIGVIKTDIKWIRLWCDTHQRQDDANFNQTREDIREIRSQMRDNRNDERADNRARGSA